MKMHQKRVVNLVVLLLVVCSIVVADAGERIQAATQTLLTAAQSSCNQNPDGQFYIHPSDKSWESVRFSRACAQQNRGGKLICADKWCATEDDSGIEGSYTITYHTNKDPYRCLNCPFAGLLGETQGITRQIEAPWSPVNFDKQEWACEGSSSCVNGKWDSSANSGAGACCGDDEEGRNPSGTLEDVDDADMGQTSCELCRVGQFGDNPGLRDWSQTLTFSDNRCCGDDLFDCGFISGSFLCTDTFVEAFEVDSAVATDCADPLDEDCGVAGISGVGSIAGKWYWKNAADSRNEGVIIESRCLGSNSYVSNGERWLICLDGDFRVAPAGDEVVNPFNGLEHGYLCVSEDEENVIYECCGSDECNNDFEDADFGGREMVTGESITVGGRIYFCRSDGKFESDLDSNSESCQSAHYPNGTSLDLVWTGRYCCSEPEDISEYYNDVNGSGVCFDNSYISNGQKVSGYPSLLVEQGQILGCNVGSINNVANNVLTTLTDSHTNGLLVDSVGFCSIDKEGFYYCDPREQWLETKGENRTQLSVMPAGWESPGGFSEGCCVIGSCWNGTGCVGNQADDPFSEPYRDDLRCMEGVWSVSEIKKGLDGVEGYCPSNEQCLVSVSGLYEDNNNPHGNPICISDGQFVDDRLCVSGEWQSRTQEVAEYLLALVNPSQDYVLYCGSYEDTLNYVDYVSDNFVFAREVFESGGTNSICLLDYQGRIVFGSSLNLNLSESGDFSEIISDFESCDAVLDDRFRSCNRRNSDTAWLHRPLNSVMYSRVPFSAPTHSVSIESYTSALGVALGSLRSDRIINNLDFEYLNTLFYDRLFIAREGGIELFAHLEENTLLARYVGTSLDICGLIGQYNATFNTGISTVGCLESGNSHDVLIYGGEFASIDPVFLWADLSGKLR